MKTFSEVSSTSIGVAPPPPHHTPSIKQARYVGSWGLSGVICFSCQGRESHFLMSLGMPKMGGRRWSALWKKVPLRFTTLLYRGGHDSRSMNSFMKATCKLRETVCRLWIPCFLADLGLALKATKSHTLQESLAGPPAHDMANGLGVCPSGGTIALCQ